MPRLTPYNFFFKHAGYSYAPQKETRAQGRRRCANALAKAERWASANGYSYRWEIDPYSDSSDWIDHGKEGTEPWNVWCAAMFSSNGVLVQSRFGVDFGRDGEPWGDPYRRVVEAELALEEMP